MTLMFQLENRIQAMHGFSPTFTGNSLQPRYYTSVLTNIRVRGDSCQELMTVKAVCSGKTPQRKGVKLILKRFAGLRRLLSG